MTSTTRTPPRVLGMLLGLLGSVCLFGGNHIYAMGGGIYFLIVGIGLVFAGPLIFSGRKAGVWVYVGLLLVMAVMSVHEAGLDPAQLLPRLGVPVLICAYLFTDRVRSRLS